MNKRLANCAIKNLILLINAIIVENVLNLSAKYAQIIKENYLAKIKLYLGSVIFVIQYSVILSLSKTKQLS